MMKKLLISSLAIVVLACDAKLSDEQRKHMKEQMELHKIRKVSEAEITEASLETGRTLVKSIEALGNDSTKIDSALQAQNGRVRWITPNSTNAQALEQQLMDAYLSSVNSGLQDNVQKIRNGTQETDSILYTKPVVQKNSSGIEELKGVWNIWLSKKEVVLSIPKK